MVLFTIKNYEFQQELGRGAFGRTYLAYDTGLKRYVAIKAIVKEGIGVNIEEVNLEIEILQELSRDNPKYMVHYYDNFDEELDFEPTKFIVTEYIEGVSLSSFIKSNPGTLPKSYLWPIMTQLLLGLKAIHDKGYAHRDIKPDNILIKANYEIKYIDFGVACYERHRNFLAGINTCKGKYGTGAYMPPEYYTETNKPGLVYAKAHDIWSLAVVFYLLAQGPNEFPYITKNPNGTDVSEKTFEQNVVLAPQTVFHYQFDVGNRTKNFVENLLITDPLLRPNIDTVLNRFTSNILLQVWDY